MVRPVHAAATTGEEPDLPGAGRGRRGQPQRRPWVGPTSDAAGRERSVDEGPEHEQRHRLPPTAAIRFPGLGRSRSPRTTRRARRRRVPRGRRRAVRGGTGDRFRPLGGRRRSAAERSSASRPAVRSDEPSPRASSSRSGPAGVTAELSPPRRRRRSSAHPRSDHVSRLLRGSTPVLP